MTVKPPTEEPLGGRVSNSMKGATEKGARRETVNLITIALVGFQHGAVPSYVSLHNNSNNGPSVMLLLRAHVEY